MRKIALCLLACFTIPCHLFASFEDNHWGARAVGMGGAFAAMADDGSAHFWNPGATGFLKKAESSFMWQRAYPGLTDLNIASGYLSLILPTRNGSFGTGITSSNFGNLLRENTALFHYGKKFGKKLGAGINLKYMTHDYLIGADPANSSNPIFANGTSQGAFTFDLGISARPSSRLIFGLAGRNLTRPDIGIASEDRISREYQAGMAVKPNENWTMEMDVAHFEEGGKLFGPGSSLLFGSEYWFWSQDAFKAAARFGLNRNLGSSQSFKNLSGGLSLLAGRLSGFAVRLDYSFAFNLAIANSFDAQKSAIHKVGFSLLFDSFGSKAAGAPMALPQIKIGSAAAQKPQTNILVKKPKKSSVYYLSIISLRPINLSREEGRAITNMIGQQYVKSAKFNILNRADIEEAIQRKISGIQPEKDADVGILTGNIHKYQGKYFIEMQYIPAGTDKLTLSDSTVIDSREHLSAGISELVQRMVQDITK